MAVEVERLLVTLEARIGGYNRDLRQAQATTNAKLAAMEARFAAWSRNLKGSASSAAMGIGSALGGIGALLGAQAVIEYANSWTRTERALDATGRTFGITLKSAADMNRLANDARVDIDAYTKLYMRTSAAIRDYGMESGTAEKVTSTLAKALKLGGATAGEQASVMLQFSQALNKGKLDGDEFRSVMENAAVVQQLLADRLKVSKGEIIKMAGEGKLQIRDLVGAMVDGGAKVDRIYRQMPQTVDEAFTVLRNNVIEFIGKADKASGASQALASGIVTISQNLGAMAVVAGAVLGSAALRMAAFAAASVSAANPITLIAAAIGALSTGYAVFGDEVAVSSDGLVSLKDAMDAFIGVVSDGASVQGFNVSLEKMTEVAGDAARGLIDLAKTADESVGGPFAAWIDASAELAGWLARITGLASLVEKTGDRARQIAFQKGIEDKNLGQGLADYQAGKKDFVPGKAPAPVSGATKRSQFEREIDQIKKRTEALKAEIATIGQSEYAQNKAKAAAELRHAAVQTAAKEGRKVSQDELAAVDALSEAYARAQSQASLLGKLNDRKLANQAIRDEIALVGLYGEALAVAKTKQDLLNEAKRLGVALTPEMERQIDILAAENGQLEQQRQIINDIRDQSQEALKGFISDMREGKSATEALGNALNRVADKLIDMAVNGLVEGALGGLVNGGGASAGSAGLASLFGFANGGVMVPGKGPANLPRFARGGVSRSAAIFGEAGPEAAVPLPDGRRIPVDLRMPDMPKAASPAASAPSLTLNLSIDARGAAPETAGRLKAELVPTIRSVVQSEVNQMFDRSPRFAKSGI